MTAHPWIRRCGWTAAALSALVVIGPLATRPGLALVGLFVMIAVAATFVHPPAAAYFVLGGAPLLAGMDRGTLLPVLRPSEALALLLGATVLVRGLATGLGGQRRDAGLRPAERSLLALVVTGSILPLLWMVVRGKPVTQLDVFHALVVWKCLAVYLIVRCTIRTQSQVRWCLLVVMAAASVAGLVGVLQSLHAFGVASLIAEFYAPEGYASSDVRFWGTSTVGHAQAMGDVMVFSLGIAVAWLVHRLPYRPVVLAMIPLFVVGALTTGEFSSAIALVVGFCTVSAVTRTLRRSILAFIPVVIVAGILMEPVIRMRLSEFSSPAGVPPSWEGRVDNLQDYVLPQLTQDYNYVFGVRPLAQVPASTDPYRYVYIESGHLWFLWTGGIPFLAAFFVFLGTNIRATRRVGQRGDAVGVAAIASLGSLAVVAVMTTLDPHLTFRGASEISFGLLGLAHLGLARGVPEGAAPPEKAYAAPAAAEPTARRLLPARLASR